MKELLAIRYAEGGRWVDGLPPEDQVLDCLGLVLRYFEAVLGVSLPDPAEATCRDEMVRTAFGRRFYPVSVPQVHDIAELPINHVGVVVPGGILHVDGTGELSHIMPMRRCRAKGFHRLRGIE